MLRPIARAVLSPLADGLHLAEHMIAGAVATAIAVTVMHPLDTVKTVAQADGMSAVAAAKSCVASGGPLALYGGVTPSVGAQVPAGAIKLASFEGITQWARRRFPKAHPVVIELASAAVAFLACSVVLVPGEVIKQRMQAGLFPTVRSAVSNTVRRDGIQGLYTGYRATLMRDIPYTMLEFGLFAQFKRLLRAAVKRKQLSAQEEWAMGGLAGGCTGLLTTPLDLAKTKLMTQQVMSQGTARQYAGILDVFVQVANKEGLPGLFRGGLTRVTWLVPFTAVFFGVHGMSKRMLLQRKLQSLNSVAVPAVAKGRKRKPAVDEVKSKH